MGEFAATDVVAAGVTPAGVVPLDGVPAVVVPVGDALPGAAVLEDALPADALPADVVVTPPTTVLDDLLVVVVVTAVVDVLTEVGDVLLGEAVPEEHAVAHSAAAHISDATQRIRTMLTLPTHDNRRSGLGLTCFQVGDGNFSRVEPRSVVGDHTHHARAAVMGAPH